MTAPSDALEEFVTGLANGLLRLYPDLEFLLPNGVLTLDVHRRDVTSVRVELPGPQILHLHSVHIEAAGVTDVVAETTRTASSAFRDFDQVLASGIVLDPGNHGTGVHTELDDEPWMQIDFQRPVDVSRITLRNVSTGTAGRARGIRVSIGVAGSKQQETVYDGAARVTALDETLAGMSWHTPPHDAASVTVLAPLVRDIVVGDFKAAQKALDASTALAPEERAAFRGLVSESLLHRHSLEWTIHGVKKSFRFWTDEERAQYVRESVALVNELRGLTDKVCFGFGTVLGIVREGGLIPHDDDIDIIIGFEPEQAATLADGIQVLRDFLGGRGYDVYGKHLAHQGVRKDGGRAADVFVGIFEGDAIAWFPGRRGSLTRDIMYPTSVAPLFGYECPLPRNPFVYLEQVYGPDWRVPNPGFRHSWGRRPFADIAGKRDS